MNKISESNCYKLFMPDKDSLTLQLYSKKWHDVNHKPKTQFLHFTVFSPRKKSYGIARDSLKLLLSKRCKARVFPMV